MEEKLNYILNEERRKFRQKTKNYTINPRPLKKITRYDSAVFYMQNKKIIGLKEHLPIKNIEFDAPSEKLTSQKFGGSNIMKFRTKLLRLNKSNLPLNQNQIIKNIFVFNKIKSKNVLIKNKILKPFIATIQNNLKEIERIKFPYSFSSCKNKSQKLLQINCLNKNSQTEKPEIISSDRKKMKKEITTIYKQDKDILKERVRINTLKYFHPKLFRRYKKFHRRKIESNDEQETEKTNMNKNYKNSDNISESCATSQLNDNISIKYELMEFNNKKNYVAYKLQRRKENSPYFVVKNKDKPDYHFLMKHPFSNNYFCGSFINHLTFFNNNSYINDYCERFQNLENPLNDNDLILKLHNLILNPNTNKIRNGELLLMYKNFPKGTFYGNKNINENIVDKELKKLEKTKYGKFVNKLNKTMKKAKEMQKELDEELYMNKKNI